MTKEQNTMTMLTISTGFLLLYFIFHWNVVLLISFIIGLIGIFSSYLSAKISWLWLKLGEILGLIVPKILLAVIFFLILYPISLLSRLTKKDLLMLSKKYNSFYSDHDVKFDKAYFEKTW